ARVHDRARVLHRPDDEARARVAAERPHLAAHRRAAQIRGVDQVARPAGDAVEVAGEEPDDRAGPARRVRLTPPEGGEDRVARVLLRPGDGEAAGVVADLVADLAGGRGVAVAPAARPVGLVRVAAGAVVGVGAADEAEAEWIRAERLLEEEAVLEDVSH